MCILTSLIPRPIDEYTVMYCRMNILEFTVMYELNIPGQMCWSA